MLQLGNRFHHAANTGPLRSSIESEPALVLGPLRSQEEQRQEQQLQEIELRRQERERRGEEEGRESPPVQEKAEELLGPFHYEFSYWARYCTPVISGNHPSLRWTHSLTSDATKSNYDPTTGTILVTLYNKVHELAFTNVVVSMNKLIYKCIN